MIGIQQIYASNTEAYWNSPPNVQVFSLPSLWTVAVTVFPEVVVDVPTIITASAPTVDSE